MLLAGDTGEGDGEHAGVPQRRRSPTQPLGALSTSCSLRPSPAGSCHCPSDIPRWQFSILPGRDEHQRGMGTFPRMTGPGNRIGPGTHVFYILLSLGLRFPNFPRFIKKTKRVWERILLFPGNRFQNRETHSTSALYVPVLRRVLHVLLISQFSSLDGWDWKSPLGLPHIPSLVLASCRVLSLGASLPNTRVSARVSPKEALPVHPS